MSFINHAAKVIHCKVVYCGTGMCGKTTNIQYVYERTHSDQKTQLVTLSTENERTLFFDFLPLDIGDVRGYQTRFHLYSIPGQTFYDISRQFILKGVDGVVFVVDSQSTQMEANLEAYELLEKTLEKQGYELSKLPLVFQYNKRDLPSAVPVAELQTTFNPTKRPFIEATASRGDGVMETLQLISNAVIQELKGGQTA